MSELHLIVEPEGEIKSHLVFIHGLQGDYLKTWTSSGTPSEFWPKWLAQNVEGLAIWSVDYDAPVSRFSGTAMHLPDRAKNILERILLEEKMGYGEINLVGHSLGGLVIKQLIRTADGQKDLREDINQFLNRVGKIAFLGTPHLGSDLASLGDKLRILIRPTAATISLVNNDPNLRDLNTWYRNWNSDRDIKHLILVETKPHKILGMIVKPDSADPGLKENATPVDCDHESICKPSSTSSEVYLHLRKLLSFDLQSPQMILLKSNYGRNYEGWKGYENWSNCPKGIEEEFCIDENIRLHNSSSVNINSNSGLTGIQNIRQKLSKEGSSIRLTGLSGVGKTRFVQALFDSRVGNSALPIDNVFYTDISDHPIPTPNAFLEKLSSLKKKTVIVIDNCPPDLHRKLTSICKITGSLLSLITVEYDVREDQPEDTDVIRLEPASVQLVERIIKAQFDFTSVGSRKIAEFSGGNFRIAIALAKTMNNGESISHLKDSELFERLFYQRNDSDKQLLRAAEVLSLVYSFKVDVDDNYYSEELTLLGEIYGVSPSKLYESIVELKRRDLIQRRGKWGAILPHAIANRLAQRALENIPANNVVKIFERFGDERVLKSFSRRLGYLNESTQAKKIVDYWLSSNGMLADVIKLEEYQINLLINIAPISQEKTLEMISMAAENNSIEFYLKSSNKNIDELVRLLRLLAYKDELFPQAVTLLCEFSVNEKERRNNSTIDLLKSLFYLHLSGTKASAETRLGIIDNLFGSGCIIRVELAFELLESSLEAIHFSSHYGFEFGSDSRDYGFYPQTHAELKRWYEVFLNYATKIFTDHEEYRPKIKEVLGKRFRGLWVKVGLYDSLEEVVAIFANDGWIEGWLGIKSIVRLDGKDWSEDALIKLKNLEDKLKPLSLLERIALYTNRSNSHYLDLESDIEDGDYRARYDQIDEIVVKLGQESFSKKELLLEVLPRLFSYSGFRAYQFGVGLAKSDSDSLEFWAKLKGEYLKVPVRDRNEMLLRGFLHELSLNDEVTVNTILDETLRDETIRELYPVLQVSSLINQAGVERIRRSLISSDIPPEKYICLELNSCFKHVCDHEFIEILKLILEKKKGYLTAIKILSGRLFRRNDEGFVVSDIVIGVAKELLIELDFVNDSQEIISMGYQLGGIVDDCFNGESTYYTALSIWTNFRQAILEPKIFMGDFSYLFDALVKKQPKAFLNGFIDGSDDIYRITDIKLPIHSGDKVDLLSSISTNTIIKWCDEIQETRYLIIASIITPYQTIEGRLEWSELAKVILRSYSDPVKILNKFKVSLKPMSWSGSRADILSKRLPLISSLKNYPNGAVSDWAKSEEIVFRREISSERKWDLKQEYESNESFEW